MSREPRPMSIVDALHLCTQGKRVRPRIWRSIYPGHWIEARPSPDGGVFVEHGDREEMPHALRLQHVVEFLGGWEEVP